MKMKLFSENEQSSSLSLEHHISRLALEANVLTNAINNLTSIVPIITQKFSDIISNYKSSEDEISSAGNTLTKYEKSVGVLSKISHYNSFSTFDRTLVTVPEGFVGNLLTYSSALIADSREIYSFTTTALDTLKQELSLFISNSEVKTSIKDKVHEYKKITDIRVDITRELGAFFSNSNVRSKAYMSDVIDRFEDVDELFKNCKILMDLNNNSQFNAIKSKTQEVQELLKIVMDDARDEPNTKVTGAAAKNISILAYETAKCVEFVGIFRFRLIQLYTCVHTLIDQLTKILKNR